jgi:5-methyltetrahydrofolate--homocysteine methyltransferase
MVDMSALLELTEAIKRGDRTEATRLTNEAMAANEPAGNVLDALLAGMDDVGQRFKRNEVYVPEVLIAARAMSESMAILEPVLTAAGIKPEFRAVIGTVQGDLHDIGKNLLGMMLRGANFEVIDLGTDVAPDTFVDAAREHHAHVVGLSALLTTTMTEMKAVIAAFNAAGLADVRIIIGGAPITQDFADQIGAHGFAEDAASGAELARSLLS